MFAFTCFYCPKRLISLKETVKHSNKCHKNDTLRYKQLELDRATGLFGYRTRTYEGVTPYTHTIELIDDKLVTERRLKTKTKAKEKAKNHTKTKNQKKTKIKTKAKTKAKT